MSLVRQWAQLDQASMEAKAASLGQAIIRANLARDRSLTIGLTGDLGAGKTTFAQGFVRGLPMALGVSSVRVTSPTYSIVQSYPTDPPVRHIDLYRLDSADELDAIGYTELTETPGINLVEWIRQIPEMVPRVWVEIELLGADEDTRTLRVRSFGHEFSELIRSLA